jgi:PAS domain-containing protein
VRGSEAAVRIHRRGQAEQRYVDYAYQPVRGAEGDIAGVLLYAADVTAHVRDRHRLEEVAGELAEAEERLRALFETMPPGVVQFSADGSVLAANPAATRILGLSESEMTHWPISTILLADDGQAEYLDDADGIMLGALTNTEFTTGVRRLSPGAALLCYTDGLVESRHRDLSRSLTLLAETLRRSAPRSAGHLCATAQAALLGDAGRADDVCLLPG